MAEKERGRPSDYTPELAAQICEAIASGKSMRAICREDWAPAPSTVFLWLSKHKEFSEQYARARDEQAEMYADELVELADLAEDVQKARLQIDTRKWVASKLLPKKYGERQVLEHQGKDGKDLIPAPDSIEVAQALAFVLHEAAEDMSDAAE